MNRQDTNFKLLSILYNLIDANPDMRFSQILINFDFTRLKVDEYYTEPEEVLERVIEVVGKKWT